MEFHPWNWYVPKSALSVLIGTFPPRSDTWSYDFFHPDVNDPFWPMLAKIARRKLEHFEGLEAIDERKGILDALNVGIVDMAKCIYRKPGAYIKPSQHIIAYMDILKMLETNPRIGRLIFLSSNGNMSAARWFKDYLCNIGMTYRLPGGGRPMMREIEIRGRLFRLIFLDPSEYEYTPPYSFDERVKHLSQAL
jgi:hypothetical protein